MTTVSKTSLVIAGLVLTAFVQGPGAAPGYDGQRPGGPPMGPGQMGGQGRGGGMGGVQPDRPLVAQFDKDGDKRLNAAERNAAYEFVTSEGGGAGPGGRMGGRGGPRGGGAVAVEPGPKLKPGDVKSFPGAAAYDPAVLRTMFLTFEDANWEKELIAFKNSDVEVPATVVVDGKTFADVGVHFRGMSSFMAVPEGQKHSINLSFDFVNQSQEFGGIRTFNLLNSHEDPTFLRTMLYLDAARTYLPAPKANYMRVAINGESWGIYVSAQQFNKDFLRDNFNITSGARWKVPGSPGARGGLEYLGEDIAAYKRVYEIKTKDDPKVWANFVKMTRVLNETPPEALEGALAPILDVDGALRFLALEVALVNGDGYWVRASDYSIYQDATGKFHVFPHDANETYGPSGGRGMGPMGPPPGGGDMFFAGPGQRGPGGPGGPGGRGGPGGGPGGGNSAELDPLVGLTDSSKPLRSKLLAVPALRARYLGYVREIALKWLDWNTIGPLATKYQALIAADVKTDTHKLDSFDDFQAGIATIKTFLEKRRAFLLNATK